MDCTLQVYPQASFEGNVRQDIVSLETETNRIFDCAVSQLSQLDVVITADGADTTIGLVDLAMTDWHSIYLILLRRLFLVSQRAIHEFLASGTHGRLVHVLITPSEDQDSRGSKIIEEALFSFVRSLTKEYGRRGIAANRLITSNVSPQKIECICETILFLSSSQASYVNGEIIRVA